MNLDDILKQTIKIIEIASEEVLAIYKQDFSVITKYDNSPVTLADEISHAVICYELSKFGFPIISEEDNQDSKAFDSEYFWLVDPLDGTKEFINRNDEFTINIALICGNRPILGVIAIPASKNIYYALVSKGAYRCNGGINQRIYASSQRNIEQVRIAVSRSHLTQKDQSFIDSNSIKNIIPLGSALKYCYIAEGCVDLSVRFTPLMSWDIAASDIILKESGASLTNFTNSEYRYEKNTIRHPLVDGVIAGNPNLLKEIQWLK